MHADNRIYKLTIEALMTRGTLAAFSNRLTKIWVAAEDPVLKKSLGFILREIDKSIKAVRGKAGQIIPAEDPDCMKIVDYCQKVISSKKPEWQIVAEQHGWTPPA